MTNDKKILKLGIIGLSEGNGHPYSWSAIFNGYRPELMADCGFPVIPDYLAQQLWPEASIPQSVVTHIWTQDSAVSQKIAQATYIDHIVENMEELVECVDAILLARDDAEHHIEMSAPFLAAGLPIYIDKPICLSLTDLDRLYQLQQYPGQIFSCSALRYGNEFILTDSERDDIGKLVYIQAVTPKDWDRYSVHIIEPLLHIIGDQGMLVSSERFFQEKHPGDNSQGVCTTYYTWESGLQASVTAMGKLPVPISLRIIGEKGFKDLVFQDAFSAFKAALNDFVDGVIQKDQRTPYEFMHKSVDMIERGRPTFEDAKCHLVSY